MVLTIITNESSKLILHRDKKDESKRIENKNNIQNINIRKVLSLKLMFSLDNIILGLPNLYNSL